MDFHLIRLAELIAFQIKLQIFKVNKNHIFMGTQSLKINPNASWACLERE